SVVGAGAVVSKDVPPFTIVGGVPAKPIRERFPKPVQDGLLAIAWWDWSHERLADSLEDFRRLDADAFVEKYASDRFACAGGRPLRRGQGHPDRRRARGLGRR